LVALARTAINVERATGIFYSCI